MTKISLADAEVIGGNRPVARPVAFETAQVVLRVSKQNARDLVVVSSYLSNTEAEGNLLTEQEWDQLVRTGQAFSLDAPTKPQPRCVFWILGPTFPGRDNAVVALRNTGGLKNIFVKDESLIALVDSAAVSHLRRSWASSQFDSAWALARSGNWQGAEQSSLCAWQLGGNSPARLALLSAVYDRLGRKTRSESLIRIAFEDSREVGEETVRTARRFNADIDQPRAAAAASFAFPTVKSFKGQTGRTNDPTAAGIGQMAAQRLFGSTRPNWLIVLLIVSVAALALGSIAFADSRTLSVLGLPLLGWPTGGIADSYKFLATILVYCMQFGFVAFEAGNVRLAYRLNSCIKNLCVFAISFGTYVLIGWRVQREWNASAMGSMLDIAFSAGFASTASLIVANVVTERASLLINLLSAVVVAAVIYPILAGIMFHGGILAQHGFLDSAGACVVHVLGGGIGLFLAQYVGPRVNVQAWYLLGRVRTADERTMVSLSFVGVFFLWFGWLGFNSGNASDSFRQLAFLNTNLGASAGGLTALALVAVARTSRVFVRLNPTGLSKWMRTLLELSTEVGYDRIGIGVMGGLVAVTANADHVLPWQASVEASVGSLVAVLGATAMAKWARWIDDPLGAIATHLGAGAVSLIVFTPLFVPHASLVVQAAGVAAVLVVAWLVVASIYVPLRYIEGRYSVKDSLVRLSLYEQLSGKHPNEGRIADDAVNEALEAIRGRELTDTEWNERMSLLALADAPPRAELIPQVGLRLSQAESLAQRLVAIVSLGTLRATQALAQCVNLGRDEWQEPLTWKKLPEKYRQALVWTISVLAEYRLAEARIDFHSGRRREGLPDDVSEALDFLTDVWNRTDAFAVREQARIGSLEIRGMAKQLLAASSLDVTRLLVD